MKTLATIILCLSLFTTYGQISKTIEAGANSDAEFYEAKMIQTSRMNMEYMDFGGKGNVLIHIQGVHNSSALKDNLDYYENYVAWRDILTEASEYYRVYAPIYRGYGNSDKGGDDIYNVENIAKDILAFMDKMKIESATFIGRTTAPQVMFYIAENHPNRVDAMVVSDISMYKTIPINNDEIKEFMYYCSYAATDLGDSAPDIIMPSYDYVPTFYTDETKKIDIPLYWPYSEQMNIVQMNLSLLNYLQPDNSFIPNEKVTKYFNDLYTNKELQNRIKQYYMENDIKKKNMDALKSAFGNHLTLQNFDEIQGADFMEKFNKGNEIMLRYLISVSSKD
jgi:pimeloyl-ACP methyl ester carboxylesterase